MLIEKGRTYRGVFGYTVQNLLVTGIELFQDGAGIVKYRASSLRHRLLIRIFGTPYRTSVTQFVEDIKSAARKDKQVRYVDSVEEPRP